VQRKGVFELNITDAILAHNKIMTQQMEALTQQMANLLQQLQVVQVAQNVNYQTPSLCYDFYGGNHANENFSQQIAGGLTGAEGVQYMENPGRQNGLQGNYPKNAPKGWRNPPNQP